MKKVIILAALLAQVFVASAQEQVRFGLKAGANFSTWTGEGTAESSFKTSFYAGGFASVPVSKHFAIQPELMYSGEGVDHTLLTYTDHYIRMPLLIQYRHASGFHVEAGPQLGLLLKSTAKHKSGEPDTDANGVRRNLESSVAIGFGWQTKMGLGFNLRYNTGISPLGDGTVYKSQVIGIGTYYVFGLHK